MKAFLHFFFHAFGRWSPALDMTKHGHAYCIQDRQCSTCGLLQTRRTTDGVY